MIRNATVGDIPDIIALGERLVKGGAFAHTQVNFRKCVDRLVEAISSPNQWVGVAIYKGRVCGFLILQIVRYWWSSSDYYVLDDGIYCERPGLGAALVRAGENWAFGRAGVREVMIAFNSLRSTERSARAIQRRLGYDVRGVVISKPETRARRGEKSWAA